MTLPFLPALPVTHSKSLLTGVKSAGHHSQSLPLLGAHSRGRRIEVGKAPLSTCCTPLSQPEAPLNESQARWRRLGPQLLPWRPHTLGHTEEPCPFLGKHGPHNKERTGV